MFASFSLPHTKSHCALSHKQRVEKLAREHGVIFPDQSYSLRVKTYSVDPSRVRALLDELLAGGSRDDARNALAVIGVSSQTADVAKADKIYEHLKEKKLNVISPTSTRLR